MNIDSTFIDSLNMISWYCYNRSIRVALREYYNALHVITFEARYTNCIQIG